MIMNYDYDYEDDYVKQKEHLLDSYFMLSLIYRMITHLSDLPS